MRGQLFQLQVHEEEVRSKYTGSHPVAVAATPAGPGSQRRAQPRGARRRAPGRGDLRQDAANRASLVAQRDILQDQLGRLQRSLAKLNDNEVRIAKLSRNARQIETQYLAYAENTEEARMDQALPACSGSPTSASSSPPRWRSCRCPPEKGSRYCSPRSSACWAECSSPCSPSSGARALHVAKLRLGAEAARRGARSTPARRTAGLWSPSKSSPRVSIASAAWTTCGSA